MVVVLITGNNLMTSRIHDVMSALANPGNAIMKVGDHPIYAEMMFEHG